MSIKIKILTLAEVPPELAHAWLQHLRDFDAANPGCHFEVKVYDATDRPLDEIREILNIDPPLLHQAVIRKQ